MSLRRSFRSRRPLLAISLGFILISSSQVLSAASPEPRLRIHVEQNGDLLMGWDDQTWRLQATDTLPAQPWLAVGHLGDTSFRVTQPSGSRFFRLVNPTEDCPLPTKQVAPPSATSTDAAFARRGPFPAHPANLVPDAQGRIGSRFQQIWEQPFNRRVRIGAITFRLDGNTPRSGYHGDLTWQADVRLGTTILSPTALQPGFDVNLQGAQMQRVHRGFLVLAGTGQGQGPQAPPQFYFPSQAAAPGDLIRIELGSPFDYDPAQGNLMLEVRVDGVSGGNFEVLFDASSPGQQIGSVWFDQGPEALFGQIAPGGAVVQFDVAREWPVPSALELARRCIGLLEIPAPDANALLLSLSDAELTARRGQLPQTGLAVSNYFTRIANLETAMTISPSDAQAARQLGEHVGIGLRAAPAAFERLADHLVGTGLTYPLFMVPGALRNMATNAFQYGTDADRAQNLPLMDEVDRIGELIFADREISATEQTNYDAAITNLCKVVEDLQSLTNCPERIKQVFRDLKTIFQAQGLLTQALASLKSIFEDGAITADDRGALLALKHALESILDLLESGGLVKELLEGLLKIICQLYDAVVSGDLVSIHTDTFGGKTYLYIDVTEAVELRLIQFFIPKELLDGFPIDIPIGLDATVKKDLVIRFCPVKDHNGKDDGVEIEFFPPDALDLDLDLDVPFAVEILEAETHIPDLDHLCIKSIKMVGGKLVIEAKSDGKDVRIEVNHGDTTIFVDGMKVYPE